MSRVSSLLVALVLLIGLGGGCEPFGTGGSDVPGPWSEVKPQDRVTIEPGLEVTLLAPDRVSAADSFEVVVTVENKTDRTVRFQTSNGCLVVPAVFDSGGERVGMQGLSIGCITVVTDRRLEGGATRTVTFDARASLSRFDPSESGVYTVPAEPGPYTLEVDLDWHFEARRVEKTLQGEFSVSP